MSKVYTIITNRIIDLLERGVVPWERAWSVSKLPPQNLISRKAYRGVNVFLTAVQGYSSPYWATYKQVKERGGYVRKGEKATPIVFYRTFEKEVDGELKTFPVLRYFSLFNTDQTDGLDVEIPDLETFEFSPIERAEKVIDGMPNRPDLKHGGNRAFYRASDDFVQLPVPEHFQTPDAYYCTSFHEHAHSTGHPSRLARKDMENLAAFGSADYSKEELIAEMSASFLCAECGIESTVENSAAYVDNWLRVLKQPKNVKMVVTAASAAQKAADFILGRAVRHD